MWIRSQNKEVIVPLGSLIIHEEYSDDLTEGIKIESYCIRCSSINVGRYKTKEICIKILDDIENLIPKYKENSTFIMPSE